MVFLQLKNAEENDKFAFKKKLKKFIPFFVCQFEIFKTCNFPIKNKFFCFLMKIQTTFSIEFDYDNVFSTF